MRAIIGTLLVVISAAGQGQTRLRIVDTRGADVVVSNAVIDYGGVFSTENETDAIRVMQGDGVVIVKWANVDTLRITKVDESVKPARVDVDVTLRNHRHIPAALLLQGHSQLRGTTDLGAYTIDLLKVRMIVPVR
jgi:hypothetical protein